MFWVLKIFDGVTPGLRCKETTRNNNPPHRPVSDNLELLFSRDLPLSLSNFQPIISI